MEVVTSFSTSILVVVKVAVFIFMALYIIFAGAVVKQVKVMTQTLEVGFEKPIIYISYVHFLVSLFVFALAILIL
ncbi:hypothetical protein KKB40_02945 [Patescibacteria group bacterium]|nr:hypothetical protein [Patescibacteria group bacterium]